MEEKKLLYRSEVAKMFGVSEQTVSNYVSCGILKNIKMDSRTYITRESVERVLKDMRSDDEINRRIIKMRADARIIHQEIRREYANARTNKSAIHILSGYIARDILIAMIRSMGERHLTDRQEDAVCAFIKGWDSRKISEEFETDDYNVRYMVYKALKAFKTLPKYSKLEDEIDELKNDNKAMSKRIESLEKELCLAKKALNIYQDMEQGNGQYSDKDFEIYKALQTKTDDIYFSKRTTNVLAYMDVKTLADLVQYKKTDLLRVRNCGRKTVREIDDYLDSVGLSFGMNVERYRNVYLDKIMDKYKTSDK
jgi:DNA-binding NarL/FixJ family response regulator